MQDWPIFNPTDFPDTKWDSVNDVLKEAERRQLAWKLWLSAAAEDPMA